MLAEVGGEVEEVREEVERARHEDVTRWSHYVTTHTPKLLVTPVLTKKPGHNGNGNGCGNQGGKRGPRFFILTMYYPM